MQEKEHSMFAMTCLKKYVDPIDKNSGKASVYSGGASVLCFYRERATEERYFQSVRGKKVFDSALLDMCLAAQGLKVVSNTLIPNHERTSGSAIKLMLVSKPALRTTMQA
jgi:hypothetical protein